MQTDDPIVVGLSFDGKKKSSSAYFWATLNTHFDAVVRAVADMGMLELTEDNVEMVLDEVRPYLMAGKLSPTLFCLCCGCRTVCMSSDTSL